MKVLLKDDTLIENVEGVYIDLDTQELVAVYTNADKQDINLPLNKIEIVLDDKIGIAKDVQIIGASGWKVIK